MFKNLTNSLTKLLFFITIILLLWSPSVFAEAIALSGADYFGSETNLAITPNPSPNEETGTLTISGNVSFAGGASILIDGSQQYTVGSTSLPITNVEIANTATVTLADEASFQMFKVSMTEQEPEITFSGGTIKSAATATTLAGAQPIFVLGGNVSVSNLTVDISKSGQTGGLPIQVGSFNSNMTDDANVSLDGCNVTGAVACVGCNEDSNNVKTSLTIGDTKITAFEGQTVPTLSTNGTVTSTSTSKTQVGDVTITLNNGTVIDSSPAGETDSGWDVGLYLPYKNATCVINEEAQITGSTGVNLRSGTLIVNGGTITGNLDDAKTSDVTVGSGATTDTGAGIEISGNPSGSGYANANLIITGGTITSQNGNGIQQDNGAGINNTLGSITIDPNYENEDYPDAKSQAPIDISGEVSAVEPGIEVGGPDSGNSSITTAEVADEFISGGTFNPAPAMSTLDPDVKYYVPAATGNAVSVFTTPKSATDYAASIYSVAYNLNTEGTSDDQIGSPETIGQAAPEQTSVIQDIELTGQENPVIYASGTNTTTIPEIKVTSSFSNTLTSTMVTVWTTSTPSTSVTQYFNISVEPKVETQAFASTAAAGGSTTYNVSIAPNPSNLSELSTGLYRVQVDPTGLMETPELVNTYFNLVKTPQPAAGQTLAITPTGSTSTGSYTFADGVTSNTFTASLGGTTLSAGEVTWTLSQTGGPFVQIVGSQTANPVSIRAIKAGGNATLTATYNDEDSEVAPASISVIVNSSALNSGIVLTPSQPIVLYSGTGVTSANSSRIVSAAYNAGGSALCTWQLSGDSQNPIVELSPNSAGTNPTSQVTVTARANASGTVRLTASCQSQSNPDDTWEEYVDITVIDVSQPVIVTPPSSSAKVLGLDLQSSGIFEFYNTSATAAAGTEYQQSQPFSLDITATPAVNTILPRNLTWTISQVNAQTGTAPTITFTPVAAQLNPTQLNSDGTWSGNDTLIGSSPYNGWTITYDYTFTPAEGTTPASVTFSNLKLNYNGTNTSMKGVYELTVSAPSLAYQGMKPQDSIRFNVVQSNTKEVTITSAPNSSTQAPSIYYQQLANGRTAQFGYTRVVTSPNSSAESTVAMGGNANWQVEALSSNTEMTSGTNGTINNYVVVNPTTGQLTFLRPFPQGEYVILKLSVDGIGAENQVLITTNGTISSSDLTAIAPQYNPVYTTAASLYNLASNVIGVPAGSYIDPEALSFTSSNTALASVFDGDQLIANNSNGTGTTTITATLKKADGTTLTTTFDVIYTSAVQPDGITADAELSLKVDGPAQNVNARLTPDNTTTQLFQGQFTYESSDTSVAVVDSFGNVTAIAPGTATITTSIPNNTSVNGTALSTSGWTTTTATTTVTVTENEDTATAITLDPTIVYLAPEGTEDATTSAEITATVDPENIDPSLVTWAADEGVTLSETTGLTTTVTSTDATGTYVVTASVPGPDETTLTATTTVIVSGDPVVIDPAKSTITATSPDFYTVTVAPVVNTAISGASSDIAKVSIFTWSQVGQTDLDCKVATDNGDGTWSYEFPVNNTPVNEYYIDASDIIVQAYASTDPDTNGNMVMNTTWNYADCGWTDGVIATPYVQDNGFITPSVGNGEVAGTTGQALQMEGIRLSTPMEGVDLVYDVHVENVGWMDQVEEGVYAGTMHQNLQMEAIHISLTGANASQYAVQYQAHVQDIGWMDWVQNGAEAGTTGQGLQMEALRIQIVPAGTALPSNNA